MEFTNPNIGGPDFIAKDDTNELFCIRSWESDPPSDDPPNPDPPPGGTDDDIPPSERIHTSLARSETTASDYWSEVLTTSNALSPENIINDAKPLTDETYIYARYIKDTVYTDPVKGEQTNYKIYHLYQKCSVSSFRFANSSAPYDGFALNIYLPLKSEFNTTEVGAVATESQYTTYWWDAEYDLPPYAVSEYESGTSISATSADDITDLIMLPITISAMNRWNGDAGTSGGTPYWRGGERDESTGEE